MRTTLQGRDNGYSSRNRKCTPGKCAGGPALRSVYGIPVNRELGGGANHAGCRNADPRIQELPAEYQIPEVGHFLRISSLLKVFDELPLIEMISSHETTIADFATFLSVTASTDAEFANLLANREMQARKLSGASLTETSPYQAQYLDELAAGGELEELIDTATRFSNSSDDVARVAAKRHLAGALLQHADPEMRKKGSDLALHNLDENWADSRDYLLASAAAESLGDYSISESIALKALEIWPDDCELRAHCRSFATQRGSQILRQRLDETGGTG